MKEKYLLLVEKSNFQLLNKSVEDRPDGKKYIVLEGIFGVLNIENRNRRTYTAEQYLPQIENLQSKIKNKKLLGELNHPVDRFDVDLNNASHVIEKLYFDESTNQIKGVIRLLNTPSGKIAQTLIEDGIPLHISSRAAGSVNPDGSVVMRQLFTYDIVYEPGFEQAELTRVNEKYGFEASSNISIYEINEEFPPIKSQDKKSDQIDNIYNKNNEMDFVTNNQFEKYSEYLETKFESLKTQLSEKCSKSHKDDDEAYEEVQEKYTALEEQFDKLKTFTNYLSETLNNSIAHNNHIVENVKLLNEGLENLSENKDQVKYLDYLSEKVDQIISHNNHIATTVNNSVDFSNYLSSKINEQSEETIKTRKYTQYVAELADKGVQYASDYLAEKIDANIQYTEDVGKKLNENINYTNYLSENINNSINYSNNIAVQINEKEGINKDLTNTQVEKPIEELNENYENSILNRLDNIINEAKRQKAGKTDDKLGFLKFLDGNRVKIFSSLNEESKLKVVKAFDENKYYGGNDVIQIFEKALAKPEPIIVTQMKPYHKAIWNTLSEAKQNSILENSKTYVLESQQQIDHFWDSVDLREEKINLESVNEDKGIQKDKKEKNSVLNESVINEDVYMAKLSEEMAKRFK